MQILTCFRRLKIDLKDTQTEFAILWFDFLKYTVNNKLPLLVRIVILFLECTIHKNSHVLSPVQFMAFIGERDFKNS